MNQVAAPYWEIFEKPIIYDSTTEYECIEIWEINVNVSQQLSWYFNLKDLESRILPSDNFLYRKVKKHDLIEKTFEIMKLLKNNVFNLNRND